MVLCSCIVVYARMGKTLSMYSMILELGWVGGTIGQEGQGGMLLVGGMVNAGHWSLRLGTAI